MKEKLHEIAEKLVMDIEKKRTGKKPLHVSKIKAHEPPGYDIRSGRRHIEVKSSIRTMTWKELTHNESKAYKNDSLYYLYLVEFDEKTKKAYVYAIPKRHLQEMAIPKMIVRFSALNNKVKRGEWQLNKKGTSYKKHQ